VMSDFVAEIAIIVDTDSDGTFTCTWEEACDIKVGEPGECVLTEVSCDLQQGKTCFAAVRPDVDGNGGVLPCTSENNRYVASLELVDGDVCGACCFAESGSQKCARYPKWECDAKDGVWNEGAFCGDQGLVCPILGACCYKAASSPPECLDTMTHVDCWNEVQDLLEQEEDPGGYWWYWRPGNSCMEYTCKRFGACCTVESDEWGCDAPVWPGACAEADDVFYRGQMCGVGGFECLPSGACCKMDGSCADGLEEDCAEDPYASWFIIESCPVDDDDDDFVCPRGACCVGEQCVETTTRPKCELPESQGGHGGEWYIHEDCADYECPQPVQE
jgi:hypothetical protein